MSRNTAVLLGAAVLNLLAYHHAKEAGSDKVTALVIGSVAGNLLTAAAYDAITK